MYGLHALVSNSPASSSDLAQLRRLAIQILCARSQQIKKHARGLFDLRELQGPAARQLLLQLLDHPDPAVQEPAAYQLAWLHDLRAVEALFDVLQDRHRHPRVVGQAAEAIGVILTFKDRRTTVMRRSTAVLVGMLQDEHPTVRFWACYALGTMRARSALPALRRTARHDTALCRGWWRVSEEAEDAITVIAGGKPPERERVGKEYPLAADTR